MAAMTSSSFTTRFPVEQGRSGYNKGGDDDDEENSKLVNYGRSGYNKGDKGDDDDEDKSE